MRKRLNISWITPIAALLVASPALVAQITTGQVSGRITDQSGNPIRARVLLTAPQMISQREVPTDANGEWRALLLPPGDYTIRFIADGFIGVTHRGIRVGAGSALRRDVTLNPVSVGVETIEITGAGNVAVDKTDTKTMVGFSADLLSQLTGSRSHYAATDLAAGVTNRAGGAQIRGGQVGSTIFRLDGADIKDPMQGEINAWWLVNDSVEDIAVVLSPLNARYGRTLGGSVDIVTKSGGNEFSGTLRQAVGRNSWEAKGRSYRGMNQTNYLGESDSISSRGQDITFSGPIIKDRVWFALSTAITPTSYSQYQSRQPNADMLTNNYHLKAWNSDNTDLYAPINDLLAVDQNTLRVLSTAAPHIQGFRHPLWRDGNGNWNPRWAIDRPYQSTNEVSFYQAKLTFAITQNHTLTLGGSKQVWEQDKLNVEWREEQMAKNAYNAQGWNINYNAILGANTFAEVKFNRQKQWNAWGTESDPDTGAWGPYFFICSSNYSGIASDGLPSYFTGGPYFAGTGWGGASGRNNMFGSLNLTMFRDFWNINHNIDVGMEFYQSDFDHEHFHGPQNFLARAPYFYESEATGEWLFPTLKFMGKSMWGQSGSGYTGLSPFLTKYIGPQGKSKNINTGVYVNDQMTINNHWNLMLGLRFDMADAKNTDGSEIFKSNNLSPRLVLTYDLKGDSAHVFKFSFSRMTSDYHARLSDVFTLTFDRQYVGWLWTGAAINQPDPGTPGDIQMGREMYGLRFVSWAEINNLANYTYPLEFIDSSKQNLRDSKLKPSTNDEFGIEYRRNYPGGSHLRMAYIYRKQGNAYGALNDYNPANWIILEDPTGTGLRPQYGNTTRYFNTSDLWRDYHGLEFESNTRFNSIFSFMLTYSYSRLRGNAEIGDATSTWADYSAPGYYSQQTYLNAQNIPMSWRSPSGMLANDIPHKVRANALAVVPVGLRGAWISYSAEFYYDSGANWTPSSGQSLAAYTAIENEYAAIGAADPTKPAGAPTRPWTWTRYWSDRGAYHFNDQWGLGVNIGWEIPIWKQIKTMGNISVWNILNVHYNTGYNTATTTMSASYGHPAYYLNGSLFGGEYNSNGVRDYSAGARGASLSMGLKF